MAVSTSAVRQLRPLIMSRTARSSPEGLGKRRHLAAIIDRLPQLPSPLSVKRLQKKADSISVLVYADALCRSPALCNWSMNEAPAHHVEPVTPTQSFGRGGFDPHRRSGITFESRRATEHQHPDGDAGDRGSDCRGFGGV